MENGGKESRRMRTAAVSEHEAMRDVSWRRHCGKGGELGIRLYTTNCFSLLSMELGVSFQRASNSLTNSFNVLLFALMLVQCVFTFQEMSKKTWLADQIVEI